MARKYKRVIGNFISRSNKEPRNDREIETSNVEVTAWARSAGGLPPQGPDDISFDGRRIVSRLILAQHDIDAI